jgi:hypothetical protein
MGWAAVVAAGGDATEVAVVVAIRYPPYVTALGDGIALALGETPARHGP